jgi:hypothetical protein
MRIGGCRRAQGSLSLGAAAPSIAALAWLLASVLALGGCGGDDGTAPPDPAVAAAITADGWTLFDSGQFAPADAKFQEAIAYLGTYADAHNGHGWSLAYLDDLSGSNAAFQSALSNGHPEASPRAGWSFVLAEKTPSDLSGAVARAGEALALEPRFIFAHDTTVSRRDLRLLRAQAYFSLNQHASAAAEVESLGGVVPPPGPNFADSLLMEIERLGE